jgi:AcrR family transcriptional regulator
MVKTRERIMQAALKLFREDGYQKTSIGRIETEAGLVPRAGAFYRHFDSKQTLLIEVAKTYVSETPEDFGFDRISDYGDTRSELVAIALKYEEAMNRQKPYARLIEEVRLLDFGDALQEELDSGMMEALSAWIRGKPAAEGLSGERRAALVISVFGSWLFYLAQVRQGSELDALRDTLLGDWATHWAAVLDASD